MKADLIKVATGLELPAATAAQQVYALIARRGAGKTNAAGVLIEKLLDASVQVIVLDPASTWWSLRLLPDGKPSPFKLPIMGAEHGDVALLAGAGALVAETLAQSTTSAVLDLGEFTLGEQRRFMTDFAETFFNAKRKHRRPVLLVLEEAADFIPQQVTAGEARMFGAIKRIAKIGRNFGIGLLMIDHRPQELHKSVLNLTEVLVVGQMSGPQERKAITGWVHENGAERDDLVGDLPSLPIGTMQVWSPQWLKIFHQVKFPLKSTFDAGHARDDASVDVKIKPIDLAELRTAMGAIAKEHETNNPTALKKRIAELEKQLAAKPTARLETKTVIKEVHVVPPKLKAVVERRVKRALAGLEVVMTELRAVSADVTAVEPEKAPIVSSRAPIVSKKAKIVSRPAPTVPSADSGLKAGCIKMINAIASSATGTRTAQQIATLTRIKVTGSTFSNYKSALKTGGYIEVNGEDWSLTPAGEALVTNDSVPETPEELLSFWRPKLKAGAFKLLEHIVGAEEVDKDEWGNVVNIDPNGSTLGNYISALVTNGLVTKVAPNRYARGEMFS